MRKVVVTRYKSADAERGHKRRHDADAENARAAVIRVDVTNMSVVRADVVIRTEDLAHQQHEEEQDESHHRDGAVDQHGGADATSSSAALSTCTGRSDNR